MKPTHLVEQGYEADERVWKPTHLVEAGCV